MFQEITMLKAAVSLCVVIVAVIIIIMKGKLNRWKNDNVPFLKPKPIFGNILDVCRMKMNFGELCKNIYDKISSPFIGIYIFYQPGLIIKDLDLVKDVLIKDFDYFVNRTVALNEKHDVIGSSMLFLMREPKWKMVRKRMTPIFTTSKIKMMSELMKRCSEQMIRYISRKTIQNKVLDARDICVKYAANSITSAFFGLEAGCFEENGSLFNIASERIFNWRRFLTAIQNSSFFFAPFLVKLFGMKFIDNMSSNYLTEYFTKTMNERETNNITRGDLLDILREMRILEKNENIESLGYHDLKDDSITIFIRWAKDFESTGTMLEKSKSGRPIPSKITKNIENVTSLMMKKSLLNRENAALQTYENLILAQGVQFFVAGFETTSSAMTFALLELARNSEIQEKLREEIMNINEKYGSICYNSLRDMEYLEKVVHETLRKYPILPFLDRRCNRNYHNVKHGLKLQKDDSVYVPVMAIHYDEKYYPNPQIFDPERFNQDNVDKRHHMSFLPFGEGPRSCIGRRFALLNAKSGLAHIILNYEIKICKKNESENCFNPRGITLQPKSEVFLEFVEAK